MESGSALTRSETSRVPEYFFLKLPVDWVHLCVQDAVSLADALEDYADAATVDATIDGLPPEVAVARDAAKLVRQQVNAALSGDGQGGKW